MLHSLDDVSQELRSRLGETLATVSRDTVPLAKVATKNMDALRAYSLGDAVYDTGRMGEAITYYRQALKLDPDFALAHVAIARALVASNEKVLAAVEIDAAAHLRERLSARDSLLVDAWQATFNQPGIALEKWRLLASLYPDYYAASGLRAFYAWQLDNDFNDAISAAERSAAAQNPHRAISQFLLGDLYLGNERYTDAVRSYLAADAAGVIRTEYLAAAFASQREFAKADQILARSQPSGVPAGDVNVRINQIAIAVDQGRWSEARVAAELARRQADKIGSGSEGRFEVIGLSLDAVLLKKNDLTDRINRYALAHRGKLKAGAIGDHASDAFSVLVAAYLAADSHDTKIAEDIFATVKHLSQKNNYPVFQNMRLVADANIALAKGRPQETIKMLSPLIDGKELYITHVTMMNAYAAVGNTAAALDQARWLAAHRGRAYAEYNDGWVLTVFNVSQSNLALLSGAEFAFSEGNKKDAIEMMHALRQAWPNVDQLASIALRVDKLDQALRN